MDEINEILVVGQDGNAKCLIDVIDSSIGLFMLTGLLIEFSATFGLTLEDTLKIVKEQALDMVNLD